MTITRSALGILCLLGSTVYGFAQPRPEDVLVPTGAPGEPTVSVYPYQATSPSKRYAELDPACMPYCYAYNHLAVPFELTLRTGPSFIVGGNRFDHVLHTGVATEITARGFCYNADHSAAWTLTMGLADTYNTADESVTTMRREDDVQATVGRALATQVVSEYGIEYLNRQYVLLEAGREWYWFGSDPCGPRLALGIDAGGRVGHAHAQITLVNRTFTPAPTADNLPSLLSDLPEFHVTDTIEGIFAGVHAGMFYNRWGYDIFLGVRGEISRDWIKIVDNDNKIDQLNVLVELGVRF